MKIGMIDDALDDNVVLNFAKVERFRIKQCKVEVIRGKEIKVSPTHATKCCNILIGCIEKPENHTLVHVDIMNNGQLNIQDFLKALELLMKQKIDILCLSIGTTILSWEKAIYPLIKEMYNRGIFIVAASSNINFITIPAAFKEVIGTISLPADYFLRDRIYALSKNNLEINYGIVTEPNEGNSFSAPLILASLLNIVDEFYSGNNTNNVRDIILKILDRTLRCTKIQWNILMPFLLPPNKVDIPIVSIKSDDVMIYSDIANCLMEEWGYESICVIDDKYLIEEFRFIRPNGSDLKKNFEISFQRSADIILMDSKFIPEVLSVIDILGCCQVSVFGNNMKLNVGDFVVKYYEKQNIKTLCKDIVCLLTEEYKGGVGI